MLKIILVGFVVYFHIFGSAASQQHVQSFQIFNSTSCESGSKSGFPIFHKSGWFQVTEEHSNYASAKIFGMWRITLCTPWGDCVKNLSYLAYGDAVSGFCMQFSRLKNGTRVALTRFGDDTMNNSTVLYLFSGSNFTGHSDIVRANYTYLSTTVTSYFFTGTKNSWEIFDQPEFTGNSTCIPVARSTKKHGRGFNFAFDSKPIIVKSIRSVPHCSGSSRNFGNITFIQVTLLFLAVKIVW